jgi:hypothetical protein
MIAQGNAISHGARAIEYSIDKDKARLVKVNDLPENIEPLAMWSRMMQHQHQCMKDRYNPKPITLNALRFEISPAKEESAGWTMTDWQNLADEFIAVLDSIDRRCGKPDSHLKPTNIKNSQYVVSLHTDSKSGIPHLHIVANRIDNMGKTNDAHYIGERAVHAANIINERRGWVQSVQRRDENIQQISEDCIAILKAMPEFDWETYCQMLNAKGYDIKLTKDDEEVVKGYAIRKGNSIYKSSILGKSRKLMPSKIKATWAGLHISKEQIPTQPTETEAQTKAHNNKEVVMQSNPITHHYSMSVDGEQFEVDIPDMVKSVFDEEFGSLDEEVRQSDVLKVAVLLFAGYLDAATSISASSGGGGSPGDGWGKDKDDDERNWAVRCARMAKWLCKPIKRSRGR